MSPEEFDRLLAADRVTLVERCLDRSPPYVFDNQAEEWDLFCSEVGRKLGTRPEHITVVGSAKYGFSQKPGRDFKPFSDESDIDLVIVDDSQFDDLWRRLLTGAYPRPPVVVSGWLKTRQRELYTGWLTPSEIRPDRRIYGPKVDPILEFSHRWFETLKTSSALVSRAHEKVNARLYRTWDHVKHYHLHSLSALNKSKLEHNNAP